MADQDFPHASLIEGVRFTAQVAVPNVVQGLFRRRRSAVAVASRTGADGLAYGFMASLKRSYGNGPLWIRVAKDQALLVLGDEAIRKVLERSPDPFASDPEPKKSGMAHFQPDALTISRNPEWKDRRRFTESVLDFGQALGDRFAAVAAQAGAALPPSFGWDEFNEAVRRVTRRVILGDGAAEDAEISELLGQLMDKSNPPGSGSAELLSRFSERLGAYVEAAEPGSLVATFADAPVTELTKPAGQVAHWLFALGDTLAINAMRCLALLAAHDEVRQRAIAELGGADPATAAGLDAGVLLEASLLEAMRLWPTTPMLSRELISDIEWGAVKVPKGTQVLVVNSFNHRDREALPYADRFAPEEWLPDGDARGRWAFNHFSHGPQVCPGVGLSLLVGKALLAALLRDRVITATGTAIVAGKPMPHGLDFFSLAFAADPA
ncbi:MAG TPA: cytochrome P450 [Solirubrobacteraceae bacterium]|nr:cytochrome P450 [Solirubrobacteraceae bacterium]